ncbi:tRNA/rRNA methyltransferase [Mangrovitalea sediminis]|uniref:tRNA/rRNA methyltransferase n=1 Tax=Mangrovitalea sediminis TaxID=1982043 RepID=UPI000BE4F35D|nr:tRNA/rRNA methyltransferase [Mangrovitalea sediminis]
MQLAFVLVEPKVPENVGAAARALKTMGFGQLWIVNSQVHREPAAGWVAHGSDDILAAVRAYDSLEAVRADADLLIGTSAKARHGKRELYTPKALQVLLGNKGDTVAQAALVFGREDRGLSNEELASCDLVTGIPLAVSYPSLNLGQAVMLYAYALSGLRLDAAAETAAVGQWTALRDRLQVLLPSLDVAPDSKLYQWALERLPLLADKDVRFLHTLCQNIEKKMR